MSLLTLKRHCPYSNVCPRRRRFDQIRNRIGGERLLGQTRLAQALGEAVEGRGVLVGQRLANPLDRMKNANVRKLPMVDSDQVALLEAGTRVQVAGKVKDRNWYLVERDDKPLGYVYGELLMEPEAAKLALAVPPLRAAEQVGLTRFRGHLTIWEKGVHDAKKETALCG